jgi:hypothetical protein
MLTSRNVGHSSFQKGPIRSLRLDDARLSRPNLDSHSRRLQTRHSRRLRPVCKQAPAANGNPFSDGGTDFAAVTSSPAETKFAPSGAKSGMGSAFAHTRYGGHVGGTTFALLANRRSRELASVSVESRRPRQPSNPRPPAWQCHKHALNVCAGDHLPAVATLGCHGAWSDMLSDAGRNGGLARSTGDRRGGWVLNLRCRRPLTASDNGATFRNDSFRGRTSRW